MDKTVIYTPSITSNLYAYLVQKCANAGVSLNSIINKAGISHQLISSWKKQDPKTVTTINSILSAIDNQTADNRRQLAEQRKLYAGRHIKTWSGIYVDVFDPKPEMFTIQDIAIGLSRKYRFGGHTKTPITVAEHSVRVARRTHSMAGLLHDASEAYLSDLPSPIKNQLTEYFEIEERVMSCIAEKFCFEWPMDGSVKIADREELQREWQELGLNYGQAWSINDAYVNFLTAYKELA